MPSKTPPNFENITTAQALSFMREHLPLGEMITITRQRFAEIFELLLESTINKHDQGHQFRTALNAAKAMIGLSFSLEETILALAAALIHDVGYNQPDEEAPVSNKDTYNQGKKAHFKKHALKGANEVKSVLLTLLNEAKSQGEKNPALLKLMSYKRDRDGEPYLIDEKGIDQLAEGVLFHNDYGTNEENYDPRSLTKGSLTVQLFDKLDICRARVYKEHVAPSEFAKNDHGDYVNPRCVHRMVPYCINDYDFSMNAEAGTMEIIYNVNLEAFRSLMETAHADFKYSSDEFERDFIEAYTKNCRVAAEAAGVILDNLTDEPTLNVRLRFTDGEERKLEFSRPQREIYKTKNGSAPLI